MPGNCYFVSKSSGFGQRHYSDVRPSPFLHSLHGEVGEYWRSPVTLSDVRKDVLAYGNTKCKPNDYYLDRAIHMAFEAFRTPAPVRMIHLNDVFNCHNLSIWKSSPGLPWKDWGYNTKDDVRRDPDAITRVRRFWHLIKRGRKMSPPDSCAFVRSHVVEYGERKVRAVWGFPATMTFGEAMFAVPLIRAYQKDPGPFAYGFETSLGGAMRLHRECNAQWYCSSDFKSFDKTVPTWLIDTAFDILAMNIDFGTYADYGVANADCNWRMYNYIRNYFINTTIRLSNGERFKKRGGVASGSYFTQLIGSIVNYILVMWSSGRQGIMPHYIKVLGDDAICGYHERFDFDLASDLYRSIGMSLNVRKCVISRNLSNVKFLGYIIDCGVPTKPYNMWMTSLLFPERPDIGWDDVASRALGLLYACAAVDARFDALCREIIRLKPFDLTIPRNMWRYLKMIGVYDLSKTPPTKQEFMLRLRII